MSRGRNKTKPHSFASAFANIPAKKEKELSKKTYAAPPLVNVVVTMNTGLPFSLKGITSKNIHANYEPDSFAAVKQRRGRLGRFNTSLSFQTGKVVIAGSDIPARAQSAAHDYRKDCASTMGIVASLDGTKCTLKRRSLLGMESFNTCKVENLIASTMLPVRRLDIEKLSKQRRSLTQWKKEVFPGLNLRVPETGATVLLFRTGSAVIMGVKTLAALHRTHQLVQDLALSIDDNRELDKIKRKRATDVHSIASTKRRRHAIEKKQIPIEPITTPDSSHGIVTEVDEEALASKFIITPNTTGTKAKRKRGKTGKLDDVISQRAWLENLRSEAV